MRIAITGASGHLGRATAERLLERVDRSDVVLVTRDPARLGAYADVGVTVRRGDFDDPAGLREALSGVDRVLIISTDALGRRIPQHRAAIRAAKEAGARHAAYTSIPNPTDANAAGVVAEHRASEEALAASGLDWTLLRNAMYAEYQIPVIEQAIATGRLVHNGGDGAHAYVSREDCAAVAAAVLSGEGHAGKAYDVTGPALLSGADRAAVAAAIGGVPVEAVPVDDETLVAGLVEHGFPEAGAHLVASFGRAIREGQLGVPTAVVEDLTGRSPRSLREVVAANLPGVAAS